MADKPISGLQKVALLLKSLPVEIVDKVLKHMDPRQGKLLISELAKVANDPKLAEKLPNIVDEAVQMLETAGLGRQGNPTQTTKVPTPLAAEKVKRTGELKQAKTETAVDLLVDGDSAVKSAANGVNALGPGADPLAALANVPAELLAGALESENGRTVFILIEKLRAELAAQIYKLLSPAKRKEISLRFAEKTAVNEQIIKQIAQGVLKKCQAVRSSVASASVDEDRQKLMATMLKALERDERMEMLTILEKSDPGLTERVKNMLYEFEVIARLENSSIQKLLAQVNMQELALAMRGAPPELEERLMANLSKRAQENLREEISLVGQVTPAKVLEARQVIVQAIQQLDERGEFILRE